MDSAYPPVNYEPVVAAPARGYGPTEVPEVEKYISGYSRKGGVFPGQSVANYQQMRFGNPTRQGGPDAYLLNSLQPGYFQHKTKLGDHGIYEATRWMPGVDGRVGSLAANRNFAGIQTKNVQGAPKRAELVERDNWFEKARPGRDVSTRLQNNDNYVGVFESKRQSSHVVQEIDFHVLKALEGNPFAKSPWGLFDQAKAEYSKVN